MAKLIIYHGDTLEREVDLQETTARLGRGDQNDIVLADPAKSVSRFHAEIRFEQGRFAIIDLNSQNGTWVAGRRVQQALLEPGVPVILGTFRLVLRDEAQPAEEVDATVLMPVPAPKATAPTPAAPPVTPSTAATMVGAAVRSGLPTQAATPGAFGPSAATVPTSPAPAVVPPSASPAAAGTASPQASAPVAATIAPRPTAAVPPAPSAVAVPPVPTAAPAPPPPSFAAAARASARPKPGAAPRSGSPKR